MNGGEIVVSIKRMASRSLSPLAVNSSQCTKGWAKFFLKQAQSFYRLGTIIKKNSYIINICSELVNN